MQPKKREQQAPGEVAPPGAIEVIVTAVRDDGCVDVTTFEGEHIVAHCPHNVVDNVEWLRAAAKIAPVEGAIIFTTGPQQRAVLWAVFPGPEHKQVRVDFSVQAARIVLDADDVQVLSKKTIAIDARGDVQIDGQHVHARAEGDFNIRTPRLNID